MYVTLWNTRNFFHYLLLQFFHVVNRNKEFFCVLLQLFFLFIYLFHICQFLRPYELFITVLFREAAKAPRAYFFFLMDRPSPPPSFSGRVTKNNLFCGFPYNSVGPAGAVKSHITMKSTHTLVTD